MSDAKKDYNPFDELGFQDLDEQKDALTEQESKGNQIDYLIHKVFEQNEDGKELIDTWVDALLMTPTARAGDDMLTIGINEGVKQFIRNIKLTVDKVERG